jgi:hypothetical protein
MLSVSEVDRGVNGDTACPVVRSKTIDHVIQLSVDQPVAAFAIDEMSARSLISLRTCRFGKVFERSAICA